MLIAAPLAASGEGDCEQPPPVDVPSSATDKAEMVAVQQRVKEYLADAEAFLACADGRMRTLAELQPALKNSAKKRQMEQQLQEMLDRYNATVDEMHLTGERYNQLLAAFKASSPGG